MADNHEKVNKLRGFGLFLLIVVLLITFFVAIVGIKNCATPVSKYIDDKWEIRLPAGELEYHDGEESFRGNGPRLTIYKFGAEPTEFLADFAPEKNTGFESAADEIITRLSAITDHTVAESYRPDWSCDYLWLHKGDYYSETLGLYEDNLYIAYFTDSRRLFICEDL